MGLLKKSTPHKSQTKIVPDSEDGILPFLLKEEASANAEMKVDDPVGDVGQLAADVFQTDEELVVVAPIAGVMREDLSINITDDVLVIKGARNRSFIAEEADYLRKECFWGAFSTSVILPEGIDVSKVTASFKDGILTVRVPKVQKLRTRMIVIKEE